MANTVNLLAASQGQVVQTAGGTQYTAVNGVFTNVPYSSDITDLLKAGATLPPAAEAAAVLPYASGRFYGLPKGITPANTITVTSTLYAYPVYIPTTITVKTLSLSVTTGQTGGAFYMGIYSDIGGVPGNLIATSGSQIATSGAGIVVYTPTAGSVVLPPGWYWLATEFTASGTYPTVATAAVAYTNELPSVIGFDTAAHLFATSAQAMLGVSNAFTYAALPAVFPTATVLANTGCPLVAIGV